MLNVSTPRVSISSEVTAAVLEALLRATPRVTRLVFMPGPELRLCRNAETAPVTGRAGSEAAGAHEGVDRITAWDSGSFAPSFGGTQVKAAFPGLLPAGALGTRALVPRKGLSPACSIEGCHQDVGGLRGAVPLVGLRLGGGLTGCPGRCRLPGV